MPTPSPIFDLGVDCVVAGLETLQSPKELAQLIERHGSGRILFSLDVRDGRPIASSSAWPIAEPFEIARLAIEAGCRQLIVLDIAGVGTGGGVSTLTLCKQIRQAFPGVTLFTGGGVRDARDLQTLVHAGIDGTPLRRVGAARRLDHAERPGDATNANNPGRSGQQRLDHFGVRHDESVSVSSRPSCG